MKNDCKDSWWDLPIRGHKKGIDRVFMEDNLKDMRELKKLQDNTVATLWINEDQMKEAK